nr:polysaccharide pyruvyl transferase family protein [uncultured Anaerotignum sp.]
MQSKNIFLWGWFGFENIGDDLLLNTTLDNISDGTRQITVAMDKCYVLTQTNVNQVNRNYSTLFSGALKYDTLIIGPGGLFPFDDKIKLLVFFFTVSLWKILGRKVIFLGIGISERMSNFSAKLWKEIIRKSNLFLTRSPNSLQTIGIVNSATAHTTSDLAFASNIQFKKNDKSNRAIVSVANLYSGKGSSSFQESVNVWAKIIQNIISRGYDVDIATFTKGSDEELACTIIHKLSTLKNHVQLIDYSSLLHSLDRWGKYDFSVCMRFHSLVLSILAGTPPFAIAYGHKTFSLAKSSGLEDYTLIWNNFQSEYYGENIVFPAAEFEKKFSAFFEDKDKIKQTIANKRIHYIENAINSFTELDGILGK